ncbi:hypothetical protein SANT12839_093290 [Streptomyces antimycoticus]|uniref:Uncharacterized protein n=1 Tax=Streptomyces antimycoticus TaxID=68175 RepID=A0A4D4KPT4_9ACTN|nr:hypothetical protein SANT12839_093290 [Streptomyces antimycoticus]
MRWGSGAVVLYPGILEVSNGIRAFIPALGYRGLAGPGDGHMSHRYRLHDGAAHLAAHRIHHGAEPRSAPPRPLAQPSSVTRV